MDKKESEIQENNLESRNEEEKQEEENIFTDIKYFFKDFIVIGIIVLILRTFVILPFQISGHSMDYSYYDKEFIIVNRIGYISTLQQPNRGDVVVFDTHIKGKEYFIKRIIGLPGETVKISDGMVYIKEVGSDEFVYLDEKYLSDDNYNATYVAGSDKEYTFEVPEGEYFVMGDNRKASSDSRTCFSSCALTYKGHYIEKSDIVGHVFVDLGYFDIKNLKFIHPTLAISTKPKFFGSQSTYDYE